MFTGLTSVLGSGEGFISKLERPPHAAVGQQLWGLLQKRCFPEGVTVVDTSPQPTASQHVDTAFDVSDSRNARGRMFAWWRVFAPHLLCTLKQSHPCAMMSLAVCQCHQRLGHKVCHFLSSCQQIRRYTRAFNENSTP